MATSPYDEDKIKGQFIDIFAPWTIKKWKNNSGLPAFIIHLTDGSTKTQGKEIKVVNGFIYPLEESTKSIKVAIDEAKKWVDSSEPTIIFTVSEGKYYYLPISEHFINTHFSENPSRTVFDSTNIQFTDFTPLIKARKKDLQAFIHGWKKINYTILKSGTYFLIKDGLKEVINKTILDVDKLSTGLNLEMLKEIDESVNRAIYTVAIVGPTKAGKSTIINSLVSKYISPINIRPTTGIPTNIVPGHTEKTEILLKTGEVVTGPANESFLNDYVSIDRNKGNLKGVRMVTVWVRSSQMEKGLSFCDFPGLDDPDPEIERTVSNALRFVNAIIYVIDASGMQNGFKFPKHYRDDLNSLKNKDRIFLVINKVDDFNDPEILEQFKEFIDEQLEELEIKSFLPYPPIYMSAKKSFDARIKGSNETNDEMAILESQVWDHLLANSKSGMHNLMNIIKEVGTESDRLIRILETRKIQGDKKIELTQNLTNTQKELIGIRSFERTERSSVKEWLTETLDLKKEYLLNYFREYLDGLPLNSILPDDAAIRKYLTDEISITTPDIFEKLEDKITDLNNQLNIWVGTKLKVAEVSIDKYSKNQFKNSPAFNQLLQPIANIFSESYGKSVPTGMWSNIAYHFFNTLSDLGDWVYELLTDNTTLKKRKANQIMNKLSVCYDEIFSKIHLVFTQHLDQKCRGMVDKVVDRTDFYITELKKQLNELNNPLTQAELKVNDLAVENLVDLDNQCANIKLQIDEYNNLLKPKLPDDLIILDKQIEKIEKEIRNSINTVLIKNIGNSVAKKIIPSHLLPKIEERIRKVIRDNPKLDSSDYSELGSTLQFFDLPEYADLISNNLYWQYFEKIFKNKENLNKHIIQLSNLRNSIRHTREITDLIVAEGKASIIWFNGALKIR